jgi:hypothetical protein
MRYRGSSLLFCGLLGCFPEVSIKAPADEAVCVWHVDDDGDGWGEDAESSGLCSDQPADSVPDGGDCDDTNGAVYPGAPEACDGLDDDCDGAVDEDAGESWYRDEDGDGYGDPDDEVFSCIAPPGTLAQAGDCNDGDAAAYPGAVEVWYDGVDNDCDGGSDYDADGDGADRDTDGGTDCDDSDPAIVPGATEVWYDGVDSDCDGSSDYDADLDGFDGTDWAGEDCADDDADVFPGSHALETPGDGVDTDCDGLDACSDLSCDGRPDLIFPGYEGPDGDFGDTLLYFSQADSTDASLHAWSPDADVALTVGAVRQALAEDLDGDGYIDLVLAVHHDATGEETDSWVYWGGAAGYSDAARTALPTEAAAAVCLGDMDGDGDTDIFVGGASDDPELAVGSRLFSQGAGVFANRSLGITRSRACAFVDFDGDGYDELIAGLAPDTEGRIDGDSGAVLLDHDPGGSGMSEQQLLGVDVRRIVVGDMTGDAVPEVVVVDRGDPDDAAPNPTRVYAWDGAGLSVVFQVQTVRAVDAAIFDADGDVDMDLVVLSGGAEDGTLESSDTVAWLQSGGSLNDGGVTPAATNPGATRLLAADLNDDGDTELLVSNLVDDLGSYENMLRLFEVSSSGRITLSGTRDLPTWGGRGQVVADLDGDGDLDVATGAWSDDAGSGRVDSRLYWNGGHATLSDAFQTLDRTALTTTAIWADPVVVGAD